MLTAEKLNDMWCDTVSSHPTAGNAHIRFARAIEAETLKAHQQSIEAAVLVLRRFAARASADAGEDGPGPMKDLPGLKIGDILSCTLPDVMVENLLLNLLIKKGEYENQHN